MYGSGKNTNQQHTPHEDELGEQIMSCDDPPKGSFVYIVPANIYGFDMQEKKWGKCPGSLSFRHHKHWSTLTSRY
jgi:hypothetical protein